jgi:hypothetical protein
MADKDGSRMIHPSGTKILTETTPLSGRKGHLVVSTDEGALSLLGVSIKEAVAADGHATLMG